MPEVAIGGNEIYFERAGAGQRLMYLNGSRATLEQAAPLLDYLAEHFDVVGYDQRGLGRSAPVAAGYGIADLAADAAGLADHLGWSDFRVFGVSFGGMVAQELAVTHPERIERLMLACTSSGGLGGSSFPLQTLDELPAEERAARYAMLVDTRFEPDSAIGRSEMLRFTARAFAAVKPEQARRGVELQSQARMGHDAFDRLARITCPTMVAAGRFDGIAPPENAEALAGAIPGSVLRLFDGGHMFLVQDPAALSSVVDFLAGS